MHRRAGVESIDGFQLKAREFEHHPILGPEPIGDRRERRTDVAGDFAVFALCREQCASERGRGGLALAARDGGDRGIGTEKTQLDLRNHRNAGGRRRAYERMCQRNPRRQDEPFDAVEECGIGAVGRGREVLPAPGAVQSCGVLVHARHLRPEPPQQFHRGATAGRETEHQDAPIAPREFRRSAIRLPSVTAI